MSDKKIFTVSIIGCGSRGCDAYGSLINTQKDKFKIETMCDVNPVKLEKYGALFGVPAEKRFTDENEFFKEKRSDLLIISTLDKQHVQQCLKALEIGYDILLEKPITDDEKECYELLAAQKKYGGKVLVCHVLRYAPAFVKIKELLDGGAVGELVLIDSIEQVTYWHQAHSYVRGNWRRAEDTTPMILAKCCHDLDLLQYYAGSRCSSVSSVGDLKYFNAVHKPEGAADRCSACKLKDSCPYSAYNVYIKRWNDAGRPENAWPYNVLTPVLPLEESNLVQAIENGPYGRCVFACDNDVVDNQITVMNFENGVKANLRMTAFTADGGRIMKFYGTLGELVLDETAGRIEIKPFGKKAEVINLKELDDGGFGHGGGDYGLVKELYEVLSGNAKPETTLAASIESHLMGIAAERSRANGGETVKIKH